MNNKEYEIIAKDKNGNIITDRIAKSEFKAKELLKTSFKCKGCIDCVDCITCQNCESCINCTACSFCKNCTDCYNITSCDDCVDCHKYK